MDNSPSKQFTAFIKLLEGDTALQARIKAADDPKQIIEIAASTGHEISLIELRVWARDLTASYFPWATRGRQWRRNFFTVSE